MVGKKNFRAKKLQGLSWYGKYLISSCSEKSFDEHVSKYLCKLKSQMTRRVENIAPGIWSVLLLVP